MSNADGSAGLAVICRVGPRLCAVPIEHAEETMRPLPLEQFAGAPRFIVGISIIRGSATPVVDARRLLGADETESPARLLTLKVGDRRVALAVDAVVAVRDLTTRAVQELPPLLREVGADAISAIGTLDSDLLVLLRTARLVPEPVWAALESMAGPR
jgi:purine-binding chemotaxis protein CheW